ncbi:RNA ligase family protein [Achromobacter sp. SIMBA_011]|jgi:RNA ligase|uniref:RNA ligase family protein n=2 Tax=Achromobacter TaxID=222 RepID=A0AAU7LDA2_9BURK|nr:MULTISPECIES: RNA ligase family protein [Achromobacter]AHC48708.1 eukaryotic DNA ligase III-like protein [Achromobacter xylosoxidans NBRC 15126 = ATCC 27061]AXA78868.1 DNA ligase [Achromobacter xylosoxidans]MCI1839951.1 RNA ligase family protein [Achromobacter ruhlandii]MCZ8410804.1 RNA ligase family protein [Achromobacter dolens]OAS95448.1 DNA ligase [Achromobacter xylosoxidans]
MTPDFRACAQSLELFRYPRTPHLEGSRLQEGDHGHDHVPYRDLRGLRLVVEEKLDGANTGISFSPAGDLLLQSRGHYLVGGGRERQFNFIKAWAQAHAGWLLQRLEDRYVMYGETLSKKHSVFYDALPHHFFEFDVLDRRTGAFLSTEARRELLAGGPVLSVPVLYDGLAPARLADLKALLRPSLAKTARWRDAFEATVRREGLDLALAWRQCDKSDLSEGLYIKVEADGRTLGRYKWVRADFVQAILAADKHHSEQPYVPNQLAPGVDLYAPRPRVDWDTLRGDKEAS